MMREEFAFPHSSTIELLTKNGDLPLETFRALGGLTKHEMLAMEIYKSLLHKPHQDRFTIARAAIDASYIFWDVARSNRRPPENGKPNDIA